MKNNYNNENNICYTGFFRDISDRTILENLLHRLHEGWVIGEYLNRAVGGVQCRLIEEEDVPSAQACEDPTRVLKAVYSKTDLEKRLGELSPASTAAQERYPA